MKWKEADGPVQGYKVRVRPISGETTPACVEVLNAVTCEILFHVNKILDNID